QSGRAPARLAGAALAVVSAIAVGCASVGLGGSGDAGGALARANARAVDHLAFGMSMDEAAGIMGEQEVPAPWANANELGPQVIRNPHDTLRFEASEGDAYVVRRYVVSLSGDPHCPFVRGEADLVPLIFFEEKLVGWRWSYLESALQRRLREDERSWSFGRFCDGAE
ncbi:MAG: hypothetical protein ACE5FL_02550, partial [Myxococcota bacterium]